MRFLSGLEPEGRTVIVRTDLNSPYDEKRGKILKSIRMRAYAETVRELSAKNAKIVLLSHQGRKGEPDFIHLDQHARMFSGYVGKRVKFVRDIAGREAKQRIAAMKDGDIILLDNVRFLGDETRDMDHSKSRIVKALAPLADVFVNDAFSVSHRNHASLVGFPRVLPSYAGRIMEREIGAEHKILGKRHVVYAVGGSKCDDIFEVLRHMQNTSVDYILTSGVAANV